MELGQIDQNRMGTATDEIDVPVLHSHWKTWYQLRDIILNGTILNATVTDSPQNGWHQLRASPWWPIWMTIAIIGCVVNTILGVVILYKRRMKRSLVVVVTSLEIASNLST